MEHTPPWETATPEALSELLCGNADAVHCVQTIARCSHTYDDLIDRDKPVQDSAIHDLIWTMLIALPVNPFYRAHQDVIRPVLITGILNWKAATDIERDGCEEELRLAHVLRYAIADVLLICMEITGGHEHAMRHARRARLMSQADTWAHYRTEHMSDHRTYYDAETLDFVQHGISVYDSSLLAATEEEHCARLFEFAGLDGWLEDKTVVDVGCGAGGVLEHLRSAYPNNFFAGATNSHVQLQIIKDKGMVPVPADMDALELPYADLFIFTQSIGHARSMPDVVAECARKLKPGGRLLIKDFDAPAVCFAATWNYRAEPFENFTTAARASGLKTVKVEFPVVSGRRYIDYWKSSEYMKSTHGNPYVVNARTAMFLFEKPQENTHVQTQTD